MIHTMVRAMWIMMVPAFALCTLVTILAIRKRH
jgi:hypothetical protein